MLMYIGGMQMTPRPRYAPSRTDDPPGTSRTFDAVESDRRGSVSLSRYGESALGESNATTSPQRNPTRMPCLTQGLTRQPVGDDGSGSAARTRPAASSVRRSAKAPRASSRSASAAWA